MEEIGKDSDGGVGGGGGGSVVTDQQRRRQRFYIELKPGETTIVSWNKLIKQSSSSFQPPPPPPTNDLIHEEESRIKRPGPFVYLEEKKHENENFESTNYQGKRRIEMLSILDEKDDVHVDNKHKKLEHVGSGEHLGSTREAQDVDDTIASAQSNNGKGLNFFSDDSNALQLTNGTRKDSGSEVQSRIIRRDISGGYSIKTEHGDGGGNELPDLNLPYAMQTLKTDLEQVNDASSCLVNGSTLERAIQELEKMVAESKQQHNDVQVAGHWKETKRRLPRVLKQKLAKVAGLAVQSGEGKISNGLFNHLLVILGHWVQQRTLKRYLREMVSANLSAGTEDDIFGQIKEDDCQND